MNSLQADIIHSVSFCALLNKLKNNISSIKYQVAAQMLYVLSSIQIPQQVHSRRSLHLIGKYPVVVSNINTNSTGMVESGLLVQSKPENGMFVAALYMAFYSGSVAKVTPEERKHSHMTFGIVSLVFIQYLSCNAIWELVEAVHLFDCHGVTIPHTWWLLVQPWSQSHFKR